MRTPGGGRWIFYAALKRASDADRIQITPSVW
jgi:hypothetical protein